MARHHSGWLGLALMIALAQLTACNLSDPLTFIAAECETDSDCNNGQCVERAGGLACECDELFEGSTCDSCIDGYTLNESGDCVEEDVIEPDLGPIDEPCLEVTPDPLDFGQIDVGRAAVLTATISNCSEGFDLDLEDVTVCLGTGDDCAESSVFEIDTIDPELPVTIAPGESATARVRFTPVDGMSEGRLDVAAGDLSGSIALTGTGVGEDCVEITAQGRTMANPTWGAQLTVGPYQTVELRAIVAAGPVGSIQSHEWSVISQPMDSNTRLLPDATAAMPTLFVDMPGEYVIEVTTFNADMEPSCDPSTVRVTAEIAADIFVDLLWDTPGDPDQTDAMGANLDLHMMHPNGMWGAAPWDVFADNQTPDWGVPADASDDPRLARSDADGLGPEFIVLSNPENVNYRVGVYGRNPNGFGPSDAMVRVYLGGMLTYAGRATLLLREFWFVGAIDWQAQTFTEVNQITLGFP